MAGPLSSEEIEDVVSSVRRLVSNEQRVKTRDLNSEKLVLTSAYRIVPEASPLASVTAAAPLVLDAPVVEAPPAPVAEPVVAEAPPAPVAEAVVKDVPAPESEAEAKQPSAPLPDVEPEAGETHVAEAPGGETVAEAPFADTTEAEWEDEIWTEPAPVSLGEAALAAEEAEVLMAPEPTAEAGLTAPASPAAEALAPEAADVIDAPVPFVHLRRLAEELTTRVSAGKVVEALVAEPETAAPVADVQTAAGQPVDPPAEVAASPEPAPEAENLPPEVAASADPAPETVAPPPAADPSPLATDLYDADGTPLAVLDEAALNEIVRQVLRVELQGELGERITRNVRKLVRAEINRALMARDLD